MGFGLIFWGLEMIRFGTNGFSEIETFTLLLQTLGDNPALTILVVSILTAIVHSSAVTIGLAMALAGQGLISLEDSVYWIFGACL